MALPASLAAADKGGPRGRHVGVDELGRVWDGGGARGIGDAKSKKAVLRIDGGFSLLVAAFVLCFDDLPGERGEERSGAQLFV